MPSWSLGGSSYVLLLQENNPEACQTYSWVQSGVQAWALDPALVRSRQKLHGALCHLVFGPIIDLADVPLYYEGLRATRCMGHKHNPWLPRRRAYIVLEGTQTKWNVLQENDHWLRLWQLADWRLLWALFRRDIPRWHTIEHQYHTFKVQSTWQNFGWASYLVWTRLHYWETVR